MIEQDSYKCSLILTPATIEEVKYFKDDLYALYVLYKDPKTNKMQIVTSKTEDCTSHKNNLKKTVDKAYFLNLGYVNIDISEIVNDRPVYMFDLDESKTVNEHSLVNGINIKLNDILSGTFKFKSVKLDVLSEISKRKKFKKAFFRFFKFLIF